MQDRTTAELMSRFYKAMWQRGLPPAAALREAQRSLRLDPRYRNSHSWAGFVLQETGAEIAGSLATERRMEGHDQPVTD